MLIKQQNANEIGCSDYSYLQSWSTYHFLKERTLYTDKTCKCLPFLILKKMVQRPTYSKSRFSSFSFPHNHRMAKTRIMLAQN